MFDITSISVADTSFLHLKGPDEEQLLTADKQAVGITLHSPGSPAYEAANSKRTNRALIRSKKKIELNADLLRADNIEFLAACTASFDNLGYPPAGDATGVDLYKALYGDRKYGFVVDQVTAHLNDWANFSKASPTS